MPPTSGGAIIHDRRQEQVKEIPPGENVYAAYCAYCVDHGDYSLEFHTLQVYADYGPDVIIKPVPPVDVVLAPSTGQPYIWYKSDAVAVKHGHYESLDHMYIFAKASLSARIRLLQLKLWPPTAPVNGHEPEARLP